MAKSCVERCPKCKKMTAHRDIHSGRLICYSDSCDYLEPVKENKNHKFSDR